MTNKASRLRHAGATWCRGWDPNPRTHTRPDLKPGAFDLLSHPCVDDSRLHDPLQSISSFVQRPTAVNVKHVAGDRAVGQQEMDAGRNVNGLA